MTSTVTSTANLNSTFTTLVNNLMTIERQPLTALNTKKDSITTQQAVYTDLGSKLTDFQTMLDSMTSTSDSYSFSPKPTVSIANTSNNSSVLSASASTNAIPAQYQIAVTSLAKEHRVGSDPQVYSDQAMNYTGSFLLGGNGTSAVSSFSSIANTVYAADTSAVAANQRELGSGSYFVETRLNSDNVWQFRMVDSSGTAVNIKKSNGNFSSDWQAIPTSNQANYDTGRGITLSFGDDPSLYQTKTKGFGAAQITYQAKGAEIDVTANDTLESIATKINAATYAQGDEVVATILDKQLILSRKATGEGNNLIASDKDGSILSQLGILNGSAFKNVMQLSGNAVFSVNNIQVTRSKNSDLSDVIQGVTLDLASDAEGEDATLTVKANPSGEESAMNSFVGQFNSLISYLTSKTATTKQSDGTYTRGALAGDDMFQNLRLNLVQGVNASVTNSGSYKRLSDIGISMADDFSLSVTDKSKFEAALSDNRQSVTAVVDSLMSKLKTTLSRYVGTSGYVNTMSKSVSNELDQTNQDISDMNDKLTKKEAALDTQYANVQTTLEMMSYQQQMMAAMFGTSVTSS